MSAVVRGKTPGIARRRDRSSGFRIVYSLALALTLGAATGGAQGRALVVCDDVHDPITLDPQKQFSDKADTLMQQIFEGLVRFDPKGKIEGALATTWMRIDPLNMEFKLRPSVRFHDGSPMDAAAVKFSIERYLDPATGSPAIGVLAPIRSVEVVSPSTVRVRTDRPDGLLLYRLAACVRIVSPSTFARLGEKGFGQTPIGTGPFRFVRWIHDTEIDLDANPDYWDKGLPRVSRLTFRYLPLKDQIDRLLAGRADVVMDLPGTRTLEVDQNAGTHVIKSPAFYTYTATLNVSRGPLAQADVRRALNMAIDRDSLVKYYSRGNGRPLATMSMPGEEGHNPRLAVYGYDPRGARALIAKAGYPGGFKLAVLAKVQAEGVIRILARQWEDVGVKVDVSLTDDAHQIQDLRSGNYDLYLAPSPNPMCHIAFLPGIGYHSKGPFSLMHYPPFDALYDRMVGEVDPDRQRALAYDLDRMIHDEALSIFTFQQIKTYGVRRDVDFVPSRTGMPMFMYTAIH